jgi:hypothetical protein
MFFKSRDQRDKEAYDGAMQAAITNLPALTGKWRHFCETIHLKPEVSLLNRIQMFSSPASKWAHDNCPAIVKTKNPLPWFFMLFSAVRSAGTHSEAELDQAMSSFAEETKLPPLHQLVKALPQEIGH